ncbi:MAG: EamA family transporter [Burkholderiaceae bacterium]
MTALTVALWLLNLVLDTAGQLAFKQAARGAPGSAQGPSWRVMLLRPWVWFGIACYCIEFFSWLSFLTLVPLSAAVLLATTNIVTVALGGWVLFGERPTRMRTCGIALVAAGVVMVGVG